MFNSMFVDDVRDMLDFFRRSMDQFFNTLPMTISDGNETAFSPNFEAGWTDDKMSLRVVLPGVTEKDLKVTVQGNRLLVEGERKAPENFSANGYSYLAYGKFCRAIDLPDSVDLDKISCRLHDGVLDVEIPVKAEMKPRQIPVAAGETRKAIAA